MATKMKAQAEEHSKKMKELMRKSFEGGTGAPGAKSDPRISFVKSEVLGVNGGVEETGRVKDVGGEGSGGVAEEWRTGESAEKMVQNLEETASSALGGRTPGLKGSESAELPTSCTETPANSPNATQGTASKTPRKPTRLPNSPLPKALYGVDDSGDWSFTLPTSMPGSGWHDVPIVLRNSQSSHSFADGLGWRSWTGESSQKAYSTKARIFFYPEADMIEVDGVVRRCGREGGRYVIREKISGSYEEA